MLPPLHNHLFTFHTHGFLKILRFLTKNLAADSFIQGELIYTKEIRLIYAREIDS